MRYMSVLFAAMLTGELVAQGTPDVKGSRDHPMISRIEGSTIKGFDQKEFDEYRLVTGTVAPHRGDGTAWTNPEEAANDRNRLLLEGKVWNLTYEIPKNRSTLEIFRSYETELTRAGFKILFKCIKQECHETVPKVLLSGHETTLTDLTMKRGGFTVYGSNVSEDQRYLAARLARATGDLYVSLLAIELNTPLARLDVVEVKPQKSSLVSVNAATMATDISTKGSVALYGIYFDTDRAEIKPESRSTLSEIATLMKQNGSLELIVVGHTDNNGTLDYNLDLSLRRSQAVVASLISEFGVARNRLEARGVAFLSPVAPNTSEENRAKNRRVQLVQR
jgi:OmpA-OmpF porin, OOP family